MRNLVAPLAALVVMFQEVRFSHLRGGAIFKMGQLFCVFFTKKLFSTRWYLWFNSIKYLVNKVHKENIR